MEHYLELAVTAMASLWIGSFLGAYMKKKGENLATHEDVNKLVAQMAAVTQATKEIESKITNDVWDRQKRWELKREVLFEATRRLADIEDGLLSLNSVLQVERTESKENQSGWTEAKSERLKKWSASSSAFEETKLLVAMVCNGETTKAFEEFGVFISVVAAKITSGKDGEIYANSQVEFYKKHLAVRAAVRKELGVDGPFINKSINSKMPQIGL